MLHASCRQLGMVTCNLACGMRHVARKRQLQQQSSHKLCSDIVEGQQHGTCKCQAIALLLPPPPTLYTQLISSKCGGAMQWQQLQIMTNTASGKSSSAHGKNFKIRIKTTAPWGKLYKQVAHAVCHSPTVSLSIPLSLPLTRFKPAIIRLWILIKCSKTHTLSGLGGRSKISQLKLG